MEEDSAAMLEVARELLNEFAALGRRVSPKMRNASRGEMGVLKALMHSERPLTPTELAERSLLSPARVANVLRALEDKGLVAREHSRADRRRVEVSLTDAGYERLERHKAEFTQEASGFLAQLGEADAREALRILRRTNQIIDQNRAARSAAGSPDPQKGGQAE